MEDGGPAPASRYALSVETGDGNEYYQDEAALVAAKEDAEWREPLLSLEGYARAAGVFW